MLTNYLKIAWRNLTRNKSFSAINILGLGLGMACSLFIYLWVQDERSYDTFLPDSDRLYKVIIHNKDKSGSIAGSMDATPGRLAEALKQEIPEVTQASTVVWDYKQLVTIGQKIGKENGRYAGPDFFTLFGFPLLQGNPGNVLSAPNNIVISEKMAQAYFGRENPIGKTIRIDDKRDYMVTGVAANVPGNSSIKFDFVLPIANCFVDNPWMIAGFDHYGPPTYVRLRSDASLAGVNAKIQDFLHHKDPTVKDKAMVLQPYRDMYLYSKFTKGIADGGRIEYVRLFSIVALFIVLIACVNFMNLATARSVKRAKEVGVRKVVGAVKSLLFGQFMAEAILTTLLSVIVALILGLALMPVFNTLTEKSLSIPFANPQFLVTILGFTLLTGFIAGSYPALVLSSMSPITVLKGSLKFKPGASLLRRGLVIFQFTLSIALIVCTAIVFRQMKYIQTKNLGLDRENVIYVPLEGTLSSKYDAFKQEIMQAGFVQHMTRASTMPTNIGMATDGISWPGKAADDKTGLWQLEASYDFTKTMKIPLVAGRDFSPAFGTDSANILINEAATKVMNLKNPVGQPITYNGRKGTIIGLMKDFHIHSLHDKIAPLMVNFQSASSFGLAIVKTKPGKTKEVLASLERSWKKLNPKYPFDYRFADEEFNRQYHSETLVSELANVFAFLAIFISCLGLFGLATFTAEQRTKEIGVRKVLGASVAGIVTLLSRDFLKPVVIAIVLATPLAWYAMSQWLLGFAYKIDMEWWVFALAGMLAVVIAILTVSFQSIKAALMNPVKSLRSE
jgi:putative ABC transport system permease protein